MTIQTRVVIAGHVDHGKSTLIGRLLSDTGQIFPERVEKVKNICNKNGKRFEFAFLLDAFEEEQGQGVTIDKTEVAWTYQGKEFLIIDTPGHKEFLKNMISGASTAEIALIMLDAEEGIRDQFKSHAYIIGMLGIKNIIIVVNKMDLVNYSQVHFEELKSEALDILNELKIKASYVIPISAFLGENLIQKSTQLSWFKGPSLADSLLTLSSFELPSNENLRFSLQDVYKFDEKRIYVGKVESGFLNIGDEVTFLPSGSVTHIKTLEAWNEKPMPTTAIKGTSIGFTLADPLFLERGEVGFKKNQIAPTLTHQMHASLFWMSKKQMKIGKNYKFKILTQESECNIESIFKVFNSQNIECTSNTEALQLEYGEAAEVIIKLKNNIVCDAFADFKNTGRFVLLDDQQVVGGGIVLRSNTINVFKESSHLSSIDRATKFGHRGAVLWLTGLSGAGKSTIAKELERRLFEMNIFSIVLDGDNLRKGICKDLGFSSEDRKENIRRTSEMAKLIAESGVIVMVALISPFKRDRQMARRLMSDQVFIEIFVDCSLEECERRDPKGLYKRARRGEIKGFTGIDSVYETPTNAEIVIDSDLLDSGASVDRIIQHMFKNNIGRKDEI